MNHFQTIYKIILYKYPFNGDGYFTVFLTFYEMKDQ